VVAGVTVRTVAVLGTLGGTHIVDTGLPVETVTGDGCIGTVSLIGGREDTGGALGPVVILVIECESPLESFFPFTLGVTLRYGTIQAAT